MSKELIQLHTKSNFKPLQAWGITDREKEEALESLIFLKEKRYGSVKGQACVGGQKQRPGLSNKDTPSPTVSLEAILITSVIGNYEER